MSLHFFGSQSEKGKIRRFCISLGRRLLGGIAKEEEGGGRGRQEVSAFSHPAVERKKMDISLAMKRRSEPGDSVSAPRRGRGTSLGLVGSEEGRGGEGGSGGVASSNLSRFRKKKKGNCRDGIWVWRRRKGRVIFSIGGGEGQL